MQYRQYDILLILFQTYTNYTNVLIDVYSFDVYNAKVLGMCSVERLDYIIVDL